MTREEIIHGLYRGDSKAIKEAVKTLEQEPCDDAVSRKDIYFKLTNGAYPNENIEQFIGRLVKELKALQTVTPEPKTGHWIFDYVSADGHRVYHCSECGCYLKPKHSEPLETFKYCSLCGAWMIEPQESEG